MKEESKVLDATKMKECKKKSPPLLENHIAIKKNGKEQSEVFLDQFRIKPNHENLFYILKQHTKNKNKEYEKTNSDKQHTSETNSMFEKDTEHNSMYEIRTNHSSNHSSNFEKAAERNTNVRINTNRYSNFKENTKSNPNIKKNDFSTKIVIKKELKKDIKLKIPKKIIPYRDVSLKKVNHKKISSNIPEAKIGAKERNKKDIGKTKFDLSLNYRTFNTRRMISHKINHFTKEEGTEGLSMIYSGLRLSGHSSKLILHTGVKVAHLPKKIKEGSITFYSGVKSQIQRTKKNIKFVKKNIRDFKFNQKQLTLEQRNMLKNFPLKSFQKVGNGISHLSKFTLKGIPKATLKATTAVSKSGTAITQSIVVENEEDIGLQAVAKADEIWTGTKSVAETVNNTTKFVSNLTGKKDLKHQKKKDLRKTKRTAQRNFKSQKLLKKRRSKTSSNTKKFVNHSKKSVQMTKASIQNVKWIVKQGAVILKQGITVLTSLLSNPIALGVIGAVIAIVLIFNILLSFATTLLSVVTADDTTVATYTTAINVEYDAFNEKLSKIIDKALSDGYETANIVYATDTGTADSDILLPILSVLSVKYEQNLTCSPEEIQDIKDCINLMYSFTEERTTSYCDGCQTSTSTDMEGNVVTTSYCSGHKHLTIYVTVKDFDELLTYLGFDETQKEWATNIYTQDENQKYSNNLGGGPGISGEYLTPEQIAALKNNAPKVNFTREEFVRTALSINTSSYSIPYFWGGKSAAGINPLWGTLKLVTAANNSNTGKYIPYGLDCSGYTSWCYLTAFDVYETDPAILKYAGFLKDGTAHQFSNATYPISRSELKPGDLVFKDRPNAGGVNHVGIYIGNGFDGRGIYAHCSGSAGTTVNSWSGFKYFRRPYIKFKGEY